MAKKQMNFTVKLNEMISESQQEIDEGIYGGDYDIFQFMKECQAELKAKDAEITGLRDYVKSYAACTWDGIGACPECGLERGVFKPQAAIEHGNIITELKAELKAKDAALEKLARLGNEPYLGNSEGNIIAQQALKEKP